jgi:hypothetical protein
MRNWYEMYSYSRERASELSHLAASIRLEREAVRLSRLQAEAVEPVRAAPARDPLPAERDMKRARATFVMERGEVLSVHARRRPYLIACVAGKLWVTMDGSCVDTVLIPGQSLSYQGKGKVVIQALRTATVRVECPSAARVVLGTALRPVFQLG